MIIGSIGISAPVLPFPKDRYGAFGQQVRETAEEISAAFSAQPKEA
jgi:DNA-binding IclR family transcriptional regulator